MGWCTLSPGEPIHQPLLDKASPKNGIQGMPTPSSAIEGVSGSGLLSWACRPGKMDRPNHGL